MTNNWKWADLRREQIELLREAEETLGPDLLLAYQPGEPANVQNGGASRFKLQIADLDDSQMECLQGLEDKLQAVVIAYRQPRM